LCLQHTNKEGNLRFPDDLPTNSVTRNLSWSLKAILPTLCLFQAVIVSSCLVITLAYFPHLDGGQNIAKTQPRIEIDTQDDNRAPSNVNDWRKAIQPHEQVNDNHSYWMYRFDKLRENDENEGFIVGPVTMKISDGEFAYFAKNGEFMSHDEPTWFDSVHAYCNGCFVGYGMGRNIISLANVTIYPQLGNDKQGGENIEDVIAQKEEHEMFVLNKGYFVVNTREQFDVTETLSHDLHTFMSGLVFKHSNSEALSFNQKRRPDTVSIVTIRHEYANFYHSSMNW